MRIRTLDRLLLQSWSMFGERVAATYKGRARKSVGLRFALRNNFSTDNTTIYKCATTLSHHSNESAANEQLVRWKYGVLRRIAACWTKQRSESKRRRGGGGMCGGGLGGLPRCCCTRGGRARIERRHRRRSGEQLFMQVIAFI